MVTTSVNETTIDRETMLLERTVHEKGVYQAFLYMIHTNILPRELIKDILITMESLYQMYIIKDALLHGWAPLSYSCHIAAPNHFECHLWGDIFTLAYDGNTLYRVPNHIYETEVRRTGKRKSVYLEKEASCTSIQ